MRQRRSADIDAVSAWAVECLEPSDGQHSANGFWRHFQLWAEAHGIDPGNSSGAFRNGLRKLGYPAPVWDRVYEHSKRKRFYPGLILKFPKLEGMSDAAFEAAVGLWGSCQ